VSAHKLRSSIAQLGPNATVHLAAYVFGLGPDAILECMVIDSLRKFTMPEAGGLFLRGVEAPLLLVSTRGSRWSCTSKLRLRQLTPALKLIDLGTCHLEGRLHQDANPESAFTLTSVYC
jgi:hypothetical protein